MLERRDFLLAERGADRDREMASGIQHNAAALVARLEATGPSGVRAALGGSPVAYGSLRAAKCILTRRDCDVNSLTRRGTKSRSGQIQQLRGLERDGIVRRTMHPQVPPKVEYGLTGSGEALKPVFKVLLEWAKFQRRRI